MSFSRSGGKPSRVQGNSIYTSAKNFIFTERASDGRYVPALNKEALEELKQVKEKLVVVSAVGAYRTGKSYLLSRLSKRAGGAKFVVGHTCEPKTKGLWLMIADHPALPGYKLALVDTEGIGDTKKGDVNHDATVFVLTCLLSNTMLYNGKNAIDEAAFEKLGFTAEMSKVLVSKSKTEGDDENFHKFFPELIYVVRDWSLELEADGRSITADQYFENALHVEEGADQTSQRSKVRRCIKKYFQRRKCFTLDIPVASKKVLSKMDSIPDDQLNPDFIETMNDLCNYILVKSESSILQNGRQINGRQVAMLVETYVNAYREHAVPNITSAMENLKKQENTKALDNAEREYDKRAQQFKRDKMPTDSMEEVHQLHGQATTLLTEQAQKEAILEGKEEVQQFLRALEERLHKKKEHYLKENERMSTEKCVATLKKLYSPIDAKKKTTYNRPNGYSEYRTDVGDMQARYDSTTGLGMAKKRCWFEFIESKKTDDESILATDRAMDEQERKLAAESLRAEQAERERQQAEMHAIELDARARENEERQRQTAEMLETMKQAIEDEKETRRQMEEERNRREQEYAERYAEENVRYQKLLEQQQEMVKNMASRPQARSPSPDCSIL